MAHRKKYLFIIMSGLGYLYSAIRLAHVLQENSQDVLVVSTDEHNLILANYGIAHFSIRNSASKNRFLDLHGWATPENNLHNFQTVNAIINEYRPDVIVTNPLAMISFIFAEKYQLPVINIGFCEYLFPDKFGTHDVKQWRITKFTETYNAYRTKIGLSPINILPTESPLIGTKYLLRSVPALNGELCLPDQVQYVGDLYFEPQYNHKPLFQFIAEAKEKGRRIAYIQIGRLFKSINVWQNLVNVLTNLQMNFVVDIGRADYSVKGLSDNFFTSTFIPIGAIKNDIDFVICTGQTTSVISSIIHGKQILAIPHSADSIELAKRLESKQLAYAIYDEEEVTIDRINELFSDLKNNSLLPSVMEYKQLFLSYTNTLIYDGIKSI